MIENGYKVPFIETPSSKVLKNNKSALNNAKFVQETILDLLKTGRIRAYLKHIILAQLLIHLQYQ